MKAVLQPGEIHLDTWSIFYLPPGNGKYNGKLTVTARRLLYDAIFDAGFKGIVGGVVRIRRGSEGYLEIDKKDIQSLEVQKKLLSRRCILTLIDGSKHTFDYGAMNIDKTVAAIEVR